MKKSVKISVNQWLRNKANLIRFVFYVPRMRKRILETNPICLDKRPKIKDKRPEYETKPIWCARHTLQNTWKNKANLFVLCAVSCVLHWTEEQTQFGVHNTPYKIHGGTKPIFVNRGYRGCNEIENYGFSKVI